jgi:hypothetical protein
MGHPRKVERAYLAFDLLPHGYVVGTVELYNIVSASRSSWAQQDAWHWLIRHPRLLAHPVRWRGCVGLFRAEILG